MNNRLESLSEILLMGPGPSCVPPSVYEALAKPTIGHLDPTFIAIMDDIKGRLQNVMKTENRMTLPVSGTGSAGMETCFVNLVEPGDAVLVLINGVFGMRMADVATRLGADVDTLAFDWGSPVVPEQLQATLDGKKYDMVAVVHAETSTGVCNPVEEIAAQVKPTGALFLLDAVTSLGGIPVDADAWGVDAMYSGTQKCLSCPPGLSPVTFSDRAVDKMMNRKTKVPNWYLDLSMIVAYWEGSQRAYHHTAPINMLYGLYQALGLVLDEGLEAVFDRHRQSHEALVQALGSLGMEMLVAPKFRLPMLNAVKIPHGVDEASVRQKLLQDHGIEIGAGLGPLAGKIWRIGLMGHTARKENVDRLIDALASVCGK
ncbi:MAG: alanine--glyoxylate aminotransferase family protein [Desulfobacterales bacterium]|nr:alanine--glyoxylate aminotransferase family protein [Desulfobacterales bacterium]